MNTNHELGRRIENEAAEWITARGATLLDRNYRCRMGEIDLVVEERLEDGRVELVFVEVRARTFGGWVDGVESVDWRKRQRLMRTARRFLITYRGPAVGLRFDILSWDGSLWTHVPNAWIDWH